jgi:hypothetical protein
MLAYNSTFTTMVFVVLAYAGLTGAWLCLMYARGRVRRFLSAGVMFIGSLILTPYVASHHLFVSAVSETQVEVLEAFADQVPVEVYKKQGGGVTEYIEVFRLPPFGRRPNGKGVSKYYDGSIKEQYWLLGNRTGALHLIDRQGAILLEGQYRDGEKSGEWKVYSEAGDVLIRGRFESDEPVNPWTYSVTGEGERTGPFDAAAVFAALPEGMAFEAFAKEWR